MPSRQTTTVLLRGALALFLLTSPVGSDATAGSLAGAAARAATRNSAKLLFKPKDVVLRRSQFPEAARHVDMAQRLGQPTVLTIDRSHALRQRRESLRHIARGEGSPRGMDRDEYPFAMTREGGQNADVRYISAGDNRGAGSSIAHQTRNLRDGDRIRVLVAD